VTLEITLAPPDVRHVEHVLPHQLRTWSGQVREVLCVIDSRPIPGLPDPGWRHWTRELIDIVTAFCEPLPHARVTTVDYGTTVARSVSSRFFGGKRIPAKTYRGGPFYAYFFGLHTATNDHILHLDSDMMFGGGSQTWAAEALALLEERTDVLACQPLPGPPTERGEIFAAGAEPERHASLAFRFATFTTRYFLLDRRRLIERVGSLDVSRHPPVRRRVGVRSWLRGFVDLAPRDRLRLLTLSTLPYELPERLIAEAMTRAGLHRVDFLGREPGMWTLHPQLRSERYYEHLPELVRRIERGAITEAQRGHYDLHGSMLS
jgi:hypothetical protein